MEEVFFCPNCMAKISAGDAKCPVCGGNVNVQNAAHQLPVNTILNGRYIIGKVLGEGGFGITYLGYDLQTDTKAAIKEYFPSGVSYRFSGQSRTVSIQDKGSSEQFAKGKERFLGEARTVYRFRDEENIVNVLDFFSENNTVYIVMEYIEGVSLGQYLSQNGRVGDFDELYKILRPVMVSLDHVHTAGLIHRDISPSNLMMDMNGTVKLLDFGTARSMSEDGEKSLSVVLKHGFAPMEQYKTHGKQGAWTDVYALCATMYKLLTGQTPVSAMDRMDSELPLPSALGVKISSAQEEVLFKGLALPVKDRIQTVGELIALFDAAAKPAEAEIKQPVNNAPKLKEKKQTESKNENNAADISPKKASAKRIRGLAIAICAVTAVAALFFASMRIIPTVRYRAAIDLMEIGEYDEAIATFEALDGYKDSAGKADACTLLKAQVGDYVSFGSYEQDNDTSNGNEAIEWLVLDKKGSKMLVISKYALDAAPYNTKWIDVTWESCTLRSWLNGDFYNSAFSENEKAMIPKVTVTADKNPDYNTTPGINTEDHVFLLSIDEANKYFSNKAARMCSPTDYAKATGASTSNSYTVDGKAACWWWLRSPGYRQSIAAHVSGDGWVNCYGSLVYIANECVRPALWIDPDAEAASKDNNAAMSDQGAQSAAPFPTPPPAAIIAGGSCGGSAEWSLTEDGTLTISGTGAMENYSDKSAQSWYGHADAINSVIISDGITHIGKFAFDDCKALTEITLPDNVTSIGSYAFSGCYNLSDVYYGGSQNDWSKIEIDGCNNCLTNARIHFNPAMPET